MHEKPNQARQIKSRPFFYTFRRKIGRNEPCPCGSGKKFKHCCLDRLNR